MSIDNLTIGEIGPDDPDFDEVDGDEARQRQERHVILVVFAPKDPDEPKRFRFPLDDLVSQAAAVAAERFGYGPGNPTFQVIRTEQILDRDQTLRQVGVHNREHVELVDAGGGV